MADPVLTTSYEPGPDPEKFKGFLRTETNHLGTLRHWFDTVEHCEKYIKAWAAWRQAVPS